MRSITPETARSSSSYSHMRGPDICCWLLDRSNCSHWSFEAAVLQINHHLYTSLCKPIIIYRSITSQLRFVLSPPLLHLRLLEIFQSDIPLSTLTWPAKHSPNQGWESTHRLHFYPLGGVFYSHQHRTPGRRDLDFTSHSKDDRGPWERFSESRPRRNRILNSGHPLKY